MFGSTAARTDSNIEDEAAGARRVELAAESKARKQAEAADLSAQNQEYAKRNATTGLRTDANIEDEAAGARRIELAEAAKARRQKELAELKARSAKLREMNASAGLRTDANIEDEAAGVARVRMAAESKARRLEQARALAKRNAELKARRDEIRSRGARTDDDITDEEAGQLRLRLAAESKHRRAVEARALARSNAEMRQKLKAMRSRTDHREGEPDEDLVVRERHASPERSSKDDGQEEEARELENLRAMLSRGRDRDEIFKKEGWDNRPFKGVPYALRGMKPVHTRDPWSQGVREAWMRDNIRPSTDFSTYSLKRLDDGSRDSVVGLFNRRKKEDREVASAQGRNPWDATPWFYTPPALKGVKPITPEPWARDAAMNEGLESEALRRRNEKLHAQHYDA
jgi:hypothetical protein